MASPIRATPNHTAPGATVADHQDRSRRRRSAAAHDQRARSSGAHAARWCSSSTRPTVNPIQNTDVSHVAASAENSDLLAVRPGSSRRSRPRARRRGRRTSRATPRVGQVVSMPCSAVAVRTVGTGTLSEPRRDDGGHDARRVGRRDRVRRTPAAGRQRADARSTGAGCSSISRSPGPSCHISNVFEPTSVVAAPVPISTKAANRRRQCRHRGNQEQSSGDDRQRSGEHTVPVEPVVERPAHERTDHVTGSLARRRAHRSEPMPAPGPIAELGQRRPEDAQRADRRQEGRPVERDGPTEAGQRRGGDVSGSSHNRRRNNRRRPVATRGARRPRRSGRAIAPCRGVRKGTGRAPPIHSSDGGPRTASRTSDI